MMYTKITNKKWPDKDTKKTAAPGGYLRGSYIEGETSRNYTFTQTGHRSAYQYGIVVSTKMKEKGRCLAPSLRP